METNIIALLTILISCIVFLKIAMDDAVNIKCLDDFFLYCKELLPGKVFGTFYASGMSLATVFIAFFQLAPFLGVKLVWSVIFYPLGLFVLWLTIPAISRATTESGTIHGFLGNVYESKWVSLIASIGTCIGFVGVFATEMIIGSYLLRSILPTDAGYWASLLFLTAVVITYSILGGFKTVVKTDKWQSLMIIVVCLLLLLLALNSRNSTSPSILRENNLSQWFLPLTLTINFFLINVPFQLVDMSAWQRISASKDNTSAKRGLFTAVIMFLITWGVILYSALLLSSLFNGTDATGGLASALVFLGDSSLYGMVLAAFCFVGLVSAMLSTADSFLIAAGQTISMDIVDREFFKNRAHSQRISSCSREDRKVISRSRIHMLIVAVCGIVLASILTVVGFQAADLIFAVYGSGLALFPAVSYALFFQKREFHKMLKFTAMISIMFGIICGWTFGILAVLAGSKGGGLAKIMNVVDILPGPPSSYNAPSYAFISAVLCFLIGMFIEPHFRKKYATQKPTQ